MELTEFKRRLMIDPHDDSAEMAAARLEGGEAYRRAAEDANAFESSLEQALAVPAPQGLAEDIIARRDDFTGWLRRSWAIGVAATVVLAVFLGVAVMRALSPPHELDDYLAWHWDHDGAKALRMAGGEVPREDLAGIMDLFGLELGPRLQSRVRFVKLCPAPDGQGAHMVLASETGPVTLFYLPGLEAGDDRSLRVNDMRAWVADLETGTVAVIASAEQEMQPVVALVREEFRVTQL